MALTVKMIKRPLACFLGLLFIFIYLVHFSPLKNKNNYWIQFDKVIQQPRLQKHKESLMYSGVDEYIRYTVFRLGLQPINSSLPLRSEFGQVINDINFQYSINPVSRCFESHQLFIGVISAPDNFQKRKLIRQTWANHLTKKKRHGRESWSANYAFLIGSTEDNEIQEQIEEESLVNQDIIQVKLVDSYNNLTLKSVALLHWSHQNCPNSQFILKCDDDVYVNTNYLATVIYRLAKPSPVIYGTFVGNTYPIRTKDDKWSVSHETWPWSRYPSYVLGGSYLIDNCAIIQLLAAVQTTPYFRFEDVYINGLCARKAGVKIMASYRMLDGVVDVSEDLIGKTWLVNNAVMWLTYSDDGMVASHLAVELDLATKKQSSINSKTKFPKIHWVPQLETTSQIE